VGGYGRVQPQRLAVNQPGRSKCQFSINTTCHLQPVTL
jgi:hypothetical protein